MGKCLTSLNFINNVCFQTGGLIIFYFFVSDYVMSGKWNDNDRLSHGNYTRTIFTQESDPSNQ